MVKSILLLFLVIISSSQGCSNICSFVLNSTSGAKNFTKTVVNGTLTGIITVSGQSLNSGFTHFHDYLQFSKSETPKIRPLVFNLYNDQNGQVDIYGEIGDSKIGNKWSKYMFTYPDIYIQISDLNIAADNHYKIHLGEPGSAHLKKYNYKNNWAKFANHSLASVTKIDNDGDFTLFNMISVCKHSNPTLCDRSSAKTINAEFGKDYKLKCSASGAPYLKAEWTQDTFMDVALLSTETYDNSTADQNITSILELKKFSFKNIGSFTCRIYNANFNTNVTKVYTFKYSKNRKIESQPPTYLYTANKEDKFNWTISGWPLDQVKLGCTNNSGILIKKSQVSSSGDTPQVSLMMGIKNETFLNLITCTVKDNKTELGTFQFTRVGATCKTGEFGVGKSCNLCPSGQTSTNGSAFCFVATNKCKSGEYGIENECHSCPFGKISPTGTVKIQDCQAVVSDCTKGYFGYQGNCTKCPLGQISEPKAAKLLDCTNVNGTCEANWYGINNSCSLCPNGSISDASTVKVQDCETKNSLCDEGDYGINNSCYSCPIGEISKPKSVKIQECWKVDSKCIKNEFGHTGYECKTCPFGKISKNGAVKIQECKPADSNCTDGNFGYNGTCTKCPIGQISKPKAAKLLDCTNVISFCKAGWYGINNSCSLCPNGSVSIASTVKVQDCEHKHSFCKGSLYGIGRNCSLCPIGMTSKKGAVKIQECFPMQIKVCTPGLYLSDNKCQRCPDGSTSKEKATDIHECHQIKKDPIVAIVAGSIGGVVFIVIIILVGLYVMRKRNTFYHKDKTPKIICNKMTEDAGNDFDCDLRSIEIVQGDTKKTPQGSAKDPNHGIANNTYEGDPSSSIPFSKLSEDAGSSGVDFSTNSNAFNNDAAIQKTDDDDPYNINLACDMI